MNFDLDDLSAGERLWLWRRRARITQDAAAARAGACGRTWRRAEADETLLHRLPRGAAGRRPKLPELLRLARRRAGLGSRGTAEAFGASVPTLLAAEAKGSIRLATFWGNRGFVFPALQIGQNDLYK